MIDSDEDPFLAGRLLQWGLRVRARPAQEPEYQSLVERYLDRPHFRTLVRELARGLGIVVLDVGEHGAVLAPELESIFALRPADFRASATVDERLLDGLVQLAIAATIFPRPRDLEEEAETARPPTTITEVEEGLRAICARMEAETRGAPDPEAHADEHGLLEAWRIYRARMDGAKGTRTSRAIIERNLDRLRELGCFARGGDGEDAAWQPTWRYQVLVKELAAARAFSLVRRALDEGRG